MSSSGDLTIRQVDGVTIIRIESESLVGILEIQHIEAQLEALIAGGTRKLVLDLKHLHFAGSAALGMLMGLLKKMKEAGGTLVLSHTEHIDPLLKVTRARALFKIAPDAKA